MALTSEDVQHIALLARVALEGDDVERFRTQLSSILDHFATLASVDTEGVEPTAHPLPLSNVMREDSVSASLPRSDVLQNAPDSEDGLFRVKAVLE